MPIRTMLFAGLVLTQVRPIGAQPVPDLAPYLMTDRAAEVRLARSAARKEVSDAASVLLLTRDGFVEAERGANGFTCLVLRSFSGALNDPEFWNPRVRAPHCFNPPAARTVLPPTLKRAQWVLGGVSPAEVESRTQRAYASHEFEMPAAGAMAYMLSPEQHLLDADPHWMPHLMLYFDKSMPAAAWGAGGMTATVIDASVGDPHSPVLTLLIPVQRWSDGRLALGDAGHK
jgi:hypothetical protein